MVAMSQYSADRLKKELTELLANYLERENCSKANFPCAICVVEAQKLTPLVWEMFKGALMTHSFPEHIITNSIRVAIFRGSRFFVDPSVYAEPVEKPKPQDEGFKLIRSPR